MNVVRARRLVVGGLATVAVALGISSVADGSPVRAVAAKVASVVAPNQSEFVPIRPCRILDSRNWGEGPFNAGEYAYVEVTGSSTEFAANGGNSGGCGIPSGATAAEFALTAVGAQGSGYVRLWPANETLPNATFLNFGPFQNSSNSGAIKIDNVTGEPSLIVAVFGGTTHVVIDVFGYYAPV